MRLFGKTENGGRALPHLRDTSRRRLDAFGGYGLYGVDDYQVRTCILNVHIDLLQRRFAHNQAVARRLCQSVCAELQLPCTLFSGDVEYPAFGHVEHGLKYQSRFSDTRFATDQHQ